MLTSEEEMADGGDCSRGVWQMGGWPDEHITCLYFFSNKRACVPSFTPAAESLIKRRPHSRSRYFGLLK